MKLIESQQKTIESQQNTIKSLQTTVHLLMSDRASQAVVQPDDGMMVTEVTLGRNGGGEEVIELMGEGGGDVQEVDVQEGVALEEVRQEEGIQEATETPENDPPVSLAEISGNKKGNCV